VAGPQPLGDGQLEAPGQRQVGAVLALFGVAQLVGETNLEGLADLGSHTEGSQGVVAVRGVTLQAVVEPGYRHQAHVDHLSLVLEFPLAGHLAEQLGAPADADPRLYPDAGTLAVPGLVGVTQGRGTVAALTP